MSTRLFTPTQEEAEALDRRTVGRQRHLAILHERLSLAATTKTRQHTLLIGARGSGKTHLLHVALYRAQSDPAINAGLSIARIPEDAVGLTSYVDLLRQLAESKGLKVGNERNPSALEQALLEDANDRTLVLVIENLDKVFSALGEDGQSDLRSWVETSGQVLIIAASPTIVASVRNRSMPWFEGLIEMPVEGLSAEEGRELLLILANDKGDSQLVEALNSDWGEARIEVVSHLTGGSPRIWLVFFDCLTIENLDELIPAVECLVEELVPYYQTLLWDLTNTQQAIVIKLAEKESVVMTASEIAAATGHSQQTVSKQLGLLKAKRWVRDLKLPNGDQRKTWYELREPMLRHHIQWRSTGGEPLRVIIDILMNSYSSTKLRDYLSLVEPGSKVERYLAESLLLSAPVYDWVVNIGTPSALIGFARELMQGKHQVFTAEVGIYVEICAELALDPMFDVNDLISIRRSQHSELEMPLDRAVSKLVYEASKEAPLENLLLATAGEEDSDISASLKLIAAGYIGKHDLERSLEILESITVDPTSTLGIQSQVAYVTGELGNTAEALKLYQELLPLQEETLGADDRDTLDTRSMIAYYTGELSDAAEALKLYQELLPLQEEALGADDRDTLITCSQIAYYTGTLGDKAEALRLYQELLPLREEALGADDRDTLDTRSMIAYYTGELSDAAEALKLYQELLPLQEEALGADDRATLSTRYQIAYYTGALGDAAEALKLYQELLPLQEEALGGDDRDTLHTRSQIAYYTGALGDAAEALKLYQELLPLREEALGADDRDTLSTRYQIAYYTGALGDAAEALKLYQELLPLREKALGSDDRGTLRTRYQIAYYTGRLGDSLEALRLFQDLLNDWENLYGIDDVFNAIKRYEVDHYTRLVKDSTGISDLFERAKAGDQEAYIRLPSELRAIVKKEEDDN